MYDSRLRALFAITESISEVEQLTVKALRTHGQKTQEEQKAALEIFQALDRLHGQLSGSNRFLDDEKLVTGYPRLLKLSAERFWSEGFDKFIGYREGLWAQEERGQESVDNAS